MTEAPDRDRKPGDGHDHSWAEETSDVKACCPDYNPGLAGTGIRCPGDPVPVGTMTDASGKLLTVLRDGGHVIVPGGRYDADGLSRLMGILADARGQLWVPDAPAAAAA